MRGADRERPELVIFSIAPKYMRGMAKVLAKYKNLGALHKNKLYER